MTRTTSGRTSSPARQNDPREQALRLALRALNTAERFRVGDTDSYSIAGFIEAELEEVNT